jgi:hypothetical protein
MGTPLPTSSLRPNSGNDSLPIKREKGGRVPEPSVGAHRVKTGRRLDYEAVRHAYEDEGKPVEAIAEEFGCAVRTIKSLATTLYWARPDADRDSEGKPTDPLGEALAAAGYVRRTVATPSHYGMHRLRITSAHLVSGSGCALAGAFSVGGRIRRRG